MKFILGLLLVSLAQAQESGCVSKGMNVITAFKNNKICSEEFMGSTKM